MSSYGSMELRGVAKGTTPAVASTVTIVDANHNAVDVYIRGGGSGGGSTSLAPGTVVTYISSDTPFTPGSSATDIWTMYGAASKSIKIYYIGLHYSGNTGGVGTFTLLRRSSTNSGGTSTSTTPTLMDASASASSATVLKYTANPSSLGTAAGQLAFLTTYPFSTGFTNGIITNNPSPDTPLFDYRLLGQPIILASASQGIALNCGGTTPSGGTVKISMRVIFTEE